MSKYEAIPKYNMGDLKQFLSLPLDAKERKAIRLIQDFADYFGEDKMYLSFSGGKDSLVVNHLVSRALGENAIERVYCDTWLEYPSMRQFVKDNFDVTVIKPNMSMKEIVDTYGWCFPSKEVSSAIWEYNTKGTEWAKNKLSGKNSDGSDSEFRQMFKKYLPIAEKAKERGIVISPFCCNKQKEEPAREFEAQSGKYPVLGLRAEESLRRRNGWFRVGCNAYDTKTVRDVETGEIKEVKNDFPQSKPISIFSEQDVLQYILKYKLELPPPYGVIKNKGNLVGQMTIYGEVAPCCTLCCSKEQRTGCCFCPIACHLNNFEKFKNLRHSFPKLFDYCMEELGEKALLDLVVECFGGSYM